MNFLYNVAYRLTGNVVTDTITPDKAFIAAATGDERIIEIALLKLNPETCQPSDGLRKLIPFDKIDMLNGYRGSSLLLFACFCDHPRIVDRILGNPKWASELIDKREGLFGAAPLHELAQRNGWSPRDHSKYIKKLLIAGAKIDLKNSFGSSPLSIAAFTGDYVAACTLLEYSKVLLRDIVLSSSSLTRDPTNIVVSYVPVIEIIVGEKSTTNPLHSAISFAGPSKDKERAVKIIRTFLDHGDDPRVPVSISKERWVCDTVEHYRDLGGKDPEIIEMLTTRIAELNAQESSQQQAVDKAEGQKKDKSEKT